MCCYLPSEINMQNSVHLSKSKFKAFLNLNILCEASSHEKENVKQATEQDFLGTRAPFQA